MPDRAGTIERLAIEVALALDQAAGRLAPGRVLETLVQLGTAFPEELLARQSLVTAIGVSSGTATAMIGTLGRLRTAIQNGDVAAIASAGLELAGQARQLLASFDGIATALRAEGPTLPGITAAQVDELTTDFRNKLRDLFVADHLDVITSVGATLTVLGVIDRQRRPGNPAEPTQPAYTAKRLRLDRLFDLVARPAALLRELYGWGDAGFDGTRLFEVLATLFDLLGVPAATAPGAPGQPAVFEAFAMDLAVDWTVSPPGLSILVALPITANVSRDIQLPHPAWRVELRSLGELPVGATGRLRPPFSLELNATAGPLDGEASARALGTFVEPAVLLALTGTTRVEASGLEAAIGVDMEATGAGGATRGELLLEGRVSGGAVVVAASDGDGFLSSILPADGLRSPFEVQFAWSTTDGLQLGGSAGLQLTVPLAGAAGPLTLHRLHLELGFGSGAGSAEVSLAAAAQLGPITVTAERFGVAGALSFPAAGGNLGLAEFGLAFKPPSGVGLDIDAGPISGGGFIAFDNGRYFGGLELRIYEITVSAFGIIDTKLPDGSRGFSFVILISAEFQPIQLGLGFTLNGVGGLLGINRTVSSQGLEKVFASKELDAILFPRDVVQRAPEIIEALQTVFPPAEDHQVFGPMAKIGWGTPTLVTADLALLLNLPERVLRVLGLVRADLPRKKQDEGRSLVSLRMAVKGLLDFPNKRFELDAFLHDSKVGGFDVSGDMALRLGWGDRPNFLLSLGGFHKDYTPPPNFPALNRLAVELGINGNPTITLSGYLAVTSNTVQVGDRCASWRTRRISRSGRRFRPTPSSCSRRSPSPPRWMRAFT